MFDFLRQILSIHFIILVFGFGQSAIFLVAFDVLKALDLFFNCASNRHIVVLLAIQSDFLHFDAQNLEIFRVRVQGARRSIEGHHRKLEILQLDR